MKKLVLLLTLLGLSSLGHALPALQLGDEGSGWTWDGDNADWVVDAGVGDTFQLGAYANALSGNGDYAWEDPNQDPLYAYLVVASSPMETNSLDGFDISFSGTTVSLVDSGYGTPPIEDPNSISGHGVYDTYFEIYEFVFDPNSLDTIYDQQPGMTGSGDGYTAIFDITINAYYDGTTGLHFDLFTVSGDGKYVPGSDPSRNLVQAFAPPSHDAQTGDCCTRVPEPGSLALIGLGLFGLGMVRRKTLKI